MLKPLERDLNEFVDNWNDHLIRHNRLSGCPSGVPNLLYEYPHVHSNYVLIFRSNIILFGNYIYRCTRLLHGF